MLSNFQFSLQATGPVFLLLAAGYAFKRLHIVGGEFIESASQYSFRIALPVMLFNSICSSDIAELLDVPFLLLCTVCMCVSPMLIMAFSRPFIKDRRKLGAFVQGAFRGNAAIVGLSLAHNIYGNNIGLMPLMLAITLPLYNIMSTLVLVLCSPDSHPQGHPLRDAALQLTKNPIIWGALLGLLFSGLKIPLPGIAASTVNSIANTATPMALLSAGAAFKLHSMRDDWGIVAAASLVKLVLQPMACLALAFLLGYRGTSLFSVLIMSGVSTASGTYVMAQNMNSDEQLAISILTVTTLFSSITLTLWIFLMRIAELL